MTDLDDQAEADALRGRWTTGVAFRPCDWPDGLLYAKGSKHYVIRAGCAVEREAG
jgi:hypothetical protein